jgi:hypothetical protein
MDFIHLYYISLKMPNVKVKIRLGLVKVCPGANFIKLFMSVIVECS